ncbi:hypothetical protein [Streptomyces sp. KMM 9044]|uniref:hypothetical protein n=1 Tax=Streptomyces sp. KMM 9044 TaxID=2744474 RepID=UPI002150F462|nr:hypothetical protein [Streptomyces sp. KMM 9044]WAX78575.1 hypothetical protein HUV60_013705 [Streptomyces sp. KMM 9044]
MPAWRRLPSAEENCSPERLAELVMTLADEGPLDVTDGIRARVKACSDPEQLRTWANRAMHVAGPESLFAAKAV